MKSAEANDVSKKTGTFKSFDGTEIYFEVRGSGRPLILCYGIACLINHWSHQIRYFSHGYQTIVFDYRGHHLSGTPRDPENLSIDAICKDIKLLMEHLQLQTASFWGHSYGVQVLLRFYDLYPGAVANFVFINGFASNPIKGMFGIDAVPAIFHLFKDGYRRFPKPISAIWKSAISNPVAIPLGALAGGFNLSLTRLKDIEVYARGVAAMDLDVFITLFEQMMSYDGSATLGRIRVPTLIIGGNKDGVTPKAHQENLHHRIRGSQFLSVPYGSHCTQLDLPEFVNLRIEKFLQEFDYLASSEQSKTPNRGPRKKSKPWETL